MSKIRDTKNVIIGLTGFLGSGCSTIAHFLAFDFQTYLNEFVKEDNSSVILHLYNKLQAEKDENTRNKLNTELKNELEKRELSNVIKNNIDDFNKNQFIYISFSDLIVYFLINFLSKERYNTTKDTAKIKNIIETELKGINFNFNDAYNIVSNFTKRGFLSSRGEEYLNKIKVLFSHFYHIKKAILKEFDAQIFQDYGDNIRKSGNPFYNQGLKTNKRSNYSKARKLAWITDKYILALKKMGYKYFVIECFKNPQELFYFREKYSYFYLFALDTNKSERVIRSRLSQGYDLIEQRESGIKIEDEKKKKSVEFHTLNVPRCEDLADVIINNDGKTRAFIDKLLRYFALIINPGCLKPTPPESLMQIAYTLSVNSNCISRQVGAIITNKEGYIIGAGWNDVGEGQISCGLKTKQDYENIDYLKDPNIDICTLDKNEYLCLKKHYKSNRSPLECCPALHAEENAILQLARFHSQIISEGTIYTTSYPCALCIKKISQVGITKVVYIESYENPIDKNILKQTTKNIHIEKFEGVKYYSYFKFFKPYYDLKDQQAIVKSLTA